MDIVPNIHSDKESLKSQGLIIGEYQIHGKHQLVFQENSEKIGIKVFEGPLSFLNLGAIEIPS